MLITLKTDTDLNDAMNNVRNAIERITLPNDAKNPKITSIETDTNRAFSLYISQKNNTPSRAELINKAIILKDKLETLKSVDNVKL